MSVSESQPVPPRPKLRWDRYSLRLLLLVVTVVSGLLAWQAHRAHQQASAVAALRELRADTMSKSKQPEWLWNLFGERFGQTTVRASLFAEDIEAAIPHLKALPDLTEVVVVVLPWDHNHGTEMESLLHQEMPHVNTQRHFLMVGWVTETETVHVPDGGAILLRGIDGSQRRIFIPEEE